MKKFICLFAAVSLMVSPAALWAEESAPTVELAVAAYDAESGELIPDPVVRYYREEYRPDEQHQIHVPLAIKEHGTFIIIGAKGYTSRRISWRATNPAEYPASYKVSMTKGATIGGQVVDEKGQPVAGATVSILGDRPDRSVEAPAFEDRAYMTTERVTTDAEGRWSFGEFPPEKTAVKLRIDGAGLTNFVDLPATDLLSANHVHTLKAE